MARERGVVANRRKNYVKQQGSLDSMEDACIMVAAECVCVCAWVVSVGMFVWWWVLHHHTKIESVSVWYLVCVLHED